MPTAITQASADILFKPMFDYLEIQEIKERLDSLEIAMSELLSLIALSDGELPQEICNEAAKIQQTFENIKP